MAYLGVFVLDNAMPFLHANQTLMTFMVFEIVDYFLGQELHKNGVFFGPLARPLPGVYTAHTTRHKFSDVV